MSQNPPEKHKVRGLKLDKIVRNRSRLLEFVSAVNNDADLDLQIRSNYLDIYYRGGCLLNIRGFMWKHLIFAFDDKYFERKDGQNKKSWLPTRNSEDNSRIWLDSLQKLKDTMDGWFGDENNNDERQLQQQICSNSTRNPWSGWLYLDVEYAAWLHGKRENNEVDLSVGRRLCKFDLIAVKREDLTSPGPLTIYVVELKQGNGALEGKAGLIAHAKDLHQFMSNDIDVKALDAFKDSVRNIIREKSELGLLPGVEPIADMDDMNIKAMFLLHECTKDIGLLQKEAQEILGEHSASPLFWKLTKDNLELVEY